MSTLWDNITITIHTYKTQYRIPYSLSRNLEPIERLLPSYKIKNYVLTKVWNKDRKQAERSFKLLESINRYDKIKLHNNCIYLTRRI